MLAHLLDDLPIAMEITGTHMQAGELAALVRDRKVAVVCFSDLPPSSASKTRYLMGDFAPRCPSCGSRWDDGDRRRWRTNTSRRWWMQAPITSPRC